MSFVSLFLVEFDAAKSTSHICVAILENFEKD